MPEAIIYKPRGRVLVDVLLIFNALLILIYPLRLVSAFLMICFALLVNVATISFWFLIASRFFKIKIDESVIYGPSGFFSKTTIRLRMVDHIRIRERSKLEKWLGIYNIWSFDGNRVMIFRKLLGRSPTNKILTTVENYPLRESHEHPPHDPSA
jgi:hypothetical protein